MSSSAAAIVGILYVAVGWSMGFGGEGTFFADPFELLWLDGVSTGDYIFVMFQMTFAIITPALITGAFAERAKFGPFLVFIVLIHIQIIDVAEFFKILVIQIDFFVVIKIKIDIKFLIIDLFFFRNLVKAGYELVVHNRSRGAVDELVAESDKITAASSPRADHIFTYSGEGPTRFAGWSDARAWLSIGSVCMRMYAVTPPTSCRSSSVLQRSRSSPSSR